MANRPTADFNPREFVILFIKPVNTERVTNILTKTRRADSEGERPVSSVVDETAGARVRTSHVHFRNAPRRRSAPVTPTWTGTRPPT